MPLYRDLIAQEFERNRKEFSGLGSGGKAVEEFQEAATDLTSEFSKDEIEEKLGEHRLPGALPTEEYSENDDLIVPFSTSSDWESHEAVNEWARKRIEGIATIAADGSQIDPVKEFRKPVGLVQVVWISNKHTPDREYDEDVEIEVLTPEDILYENPNTGHMRVDDQEVPLTRFEMETRVLKEKIEEHRDDQTPPIIFYDGPLILSYIQVMDEFAKKRHGDAMAQLLAASKYHKVPVVGYISGSRATEISEMIKKLELVNARQKARDYRILEPLMNNWGDRCVLFESRRDETLDRLQTTYRGVDYDFSDNILFTYLNTGGGAQMARLELPRWIQEERMIDHLISAVRAECGVGLGYPEILQEVDTDAVISYKQRDEFLGIYQEFMEENDIKLKWNNKSLSKKRRRR